MPQNLFRLIFLLPLAGFTQVLEEVCPSSLDFYGVEEERITDWVEIYNDYPGLINLEDFYISDDQYDLHKWQLPPIHLEPGDRTVLSASDYPNSETTIPFSFDQEGGSLFLADEDEEIVSVMHYPALHPNDSYGRIAGQHYYFDNPTPNEANELSAGYKGYATSPEVNRQSGTYPAGTVIVLKSPEEEADILYAVNGRSLKNPIVYDEPLVLKKTITLKVSAKKDSLINAFPVYRTYFVNETHYLPVVHLTVDSLEMFDEEDGIYMPGPDASPDLPYLGANFWKRIEIEGHFAYFDDQLVLQEELECGLKIHGGTGSRVHPMKSLQIRAKKSYDQSYFRHTYFKHKNVKDLKRIVLRNSGNDYCKTGLKDGVLQAYFLKEKLDVDLMGYQPAVLYINGEYVGIENIREKPDRFYTSSNYEDVDPYEINLLLHSKLIINEGDNISYQNIKDYAFFNDLSDSVHFNWVEERIDLMSMVDYFVLQLFINNRDWPKGNIKVWNAKGHKWRFLCYDLDFGLRYYWNTAELKHTTYDILNNFPEISPHVFILVRLLENEEFRRYFINRYADLLNTTFQAEPMYEALMEGKENIAKEMAVHREKWCKDANDWDSYFEKIKEFLDERVEVVHADLSRTFEKPLRSNIVVDNYPADAGTIQLNTLLLEKFPLKGTYFETNSIDMTAIPNPGEVFQYWENTRTGERWYVRQIQVDPVNDDRYIAVYRSTKKLYHLSVRPNPVTDILNLNFSLPETAVTTVEIVDVSGKRVLFYNPENQMSKGTHELSFDVDHLDPGMYLVSLSTVQGREALRIYKQ